MKKIKSQGSRSKATSEYPWIAQAKDLPAKQGMLQLVRSELKSEMKSGFRQVDSKLEQVLSEVSRVGLLVEEQNSRNSVVLEGLTGLWDRQKRVESRVDEVEKSVQSIARTRT